MLIDFTQLDTDLLGNPFSESELADLELLVFPSMSIGQIADGLYYDDLDQTAISVLLTAPATVGPVRLSSFGIGGRIVALDLVFAEGTGIWLVRLNTPERDGPLAYLALEASGSATSDVVQWTDAMSEMSGSADLGSADPVPVVVDEDQTFDWSGLTEDAFGGQIANVRIDRASLLHVDASVSEVEDAWTDLFALAPDVWTADVSGRETVSLSEFVGTLGAGVGAPFEGLNDTGTWILTLGCACQNPIAKAAFVLKPEDGDR